MAPIRQQDGYKSAYSFTTTKPFPEYKMTLGTERVLKGKSLAEVPNVPLKPMTMREYDDFYYSQFEIATKKYKEQAEASGLSPVNVDRVKTLIDNHCNDFSIENQEGFTVKIDAKKNEVTICGHQYLLDENGGIRKEVYPNGSYDVYDPTLMDQKSVNAFKELSAKYNGGIPLDHPNYSYSVYYDNDRGGLYSDPSDGRIAFTQKDLNDYIANH